ncbi:MAG TPA: TerC family protein [Gallionella sp.]
MTMTVWVFFFAFVLLMLALDLGVFHRKSHPVSVKEAMGWSVAWFVLSMLFAILVYFAYEGQWSGLGTVPDQVDGLANDGASATGKYMTGYVLEKSLSVDNIFVIAMIFRFFSVPPVYQHRVLFLGILGALILRGVMIALGAKLVAEFHWVLYLFACFLIVTAIRMLFFLKAGHADPNRNEVVKLTRRLFPVTARFHGEHFIVRAGAPASRESETPDAPVVRDEIVERAPPGTVLLTPLALALIMVETSDVVFAVDSIPAIFAITSDPFLVYTSNVFAMLGLRSLYFALAGIVDRFRYLKTALALVLMVVGVKMLLADWLKIALGGHFNLLLLMLVLAILSAGIGLSLLTDRQKNRPQSQSRN